MNTIIDKSVARPRFTTLLLSGFAMLGVVLGASGIYSVLAYTVARRTQEIGIRRALGASTQRVIQNIVTGGMQPVVIGLVLGLVGSFWTTQLLKTQLFEVSTTDPRTYLMTLAAVLAISLLATLIPAYRALRVNPIAALRSE